jgi:NAD(P)-dependent dehydrogenase (short-subunit alcohol dehydrogenase family)
MKSCRLIAAVLALTPFAAQALTVTIVDLNDNTTETFNGANNVIIGAGGSNILDKYWEFNSVLSISNESFEVADGSAVLGSASFSLSALSAGTNVGIRVEEEFDLNYDGPGTVTSSANAATLIDAAVFFDTGINNTVLDTAFFDTTAQDYQKSFAVDLTSPFTLTQEFVLDADAIGATVGFDVSTTASPVPIPAAAWLFGSALLGFVAIGRRKLAATAA